MTTSREELISIQQQLVEELKENIYDTVGRRDPVLDRYYRDYQREFKQGYERASSRDEIIQRLMRAHIAYFGDYHTLRAAQSEVLELLKGAAERGRKIVLAVEMLHAADKHHAQDYLDREIDDEALRWRVRWGRSWGFPWASYGRFFDFVESEDVYLFGININADYREGDLRYRDAFAADLVAALTHLYPERLVAVVYGDLHLAPNHLPGDVEKRLARYGASRRTVTVYQNSETLYWQLVQQHLEHVVDYIKLKRNVYVAMNATPLVKFQSFANWQHRRSELAFEDHTGFEVDLLGESALLEQVHDYIVTVTEFLGVKLDETANFMLYTAADLDLFEDLVQRGVYSADEMEALKDYVAMAHSAFFDRARVLYIGNFTVANTAEAAARYVLGELRPAGDEPVDARDEFYGRCMVEALAFFCSKIIDSHRHARNEESWRMVLEEFGRRRKLGRIQRLDVLVARAFLKHKKYEKRVVETGRFNGAPRSLFDLPTDQHVALTRALGRALGDKLYAELGDRVSKELIVEAMHDPSRKPDQARNRYFELSKLTWGTVAVSGRLKAVPPRGFHEEE